MNTYKVSNKCPKCGGCEISDQYHKDQWPCNRYRHDKPVWDKEHIHRTCKRCGYEWAEEPLEIDP